MFVRGWRSFDIRRVLSLSASQSLQTRGRTGQRDLTILALPDKVGFASAATHFILLEAAYRDEVGVYLAT